MQETSAAQPSLLPYDSSSVWPCLLLLACTPGCCMPPFIRDILLAEPTSQPCMFWHAPSSKQRMHAWSRQTGSPAVPTCIMIAPALPRVPRISIKLNAGAHVTVAAAATTAPLPPAW
mmetsp:Transcript_2036/g.4516  ORF Transcript_2036/g.4516 Transcript_2036/m.4516 type:complete len:117 (-) Transcript_2036:212-562(-)